MVIREIITKPLETIVAKYVMAVNDATQWGEGLYLEQIITCDLQREIIHEQEGHRKSCTLMIYTL